MNRPRVIRWFRIAVSAVCLGMFVGLMGLWNDSAAVEEPTTSKEIPLTSGYSTSGQRGMQPVAYRVEKDQRVPVAEIVNAFGQIKDLNGSSNIFLVDAPDIVGAVQASIGVILGGRRADIPAPLNIPDAPRGTPWLVAYLGIAGSTPPRWTVDSITVNKNAIRFNYHKSIARTKDMHRYFYWVPLGSLKDGVYSLELFDNDLDAVTLMRRVEIASSR